MLPLQQAYEVKQSIIEYLKATFKFKEQKVHESFFNFFEDPSEGIFRDHTCLSSYLLKLPKQRKHPFGGSPKFPSV